MVKLWRAETPLIISKIFEEKARKLVRNFFRMQQNNRHGQSFKSKGNCLGHWDQSLEPKYSFSKFSGSPSSSAPLPTCSVLVCMCLMSPGRDNIQYVTNIPTTTIIPQLSNFTSCISHQISLWSKEIFISLWFTFTHQNISLIFSISVLIPNILASDQER